MDYKTYAKRVYYDVYQGLRVSMMNLWLNVY